MLSTLGQRLARLFRATAPDPFVLAILLTALTSLLAPFMTPPPAGATTGEYPRTLLDAWQ